MSRWPCDAIELVDGIPRQAWPPRLVYGAESVVTRCAIRLWTVRGTWPDDVLLGLDHMAWVLPQTPAVVIEALVRRQLGAVEGVIRVREVLITRPGTDLDIAAVLDVSDGDGGSLSVVVGSLVEPTGVYAGLIPGTWYVLLGGSRPIVPMGVW